MRPPGRRNEHTGESTMTYRLRFITAVLPAFVLLIAAGTTARAEKRLRPPPGPGSVNLPYVVNDNTGNQWMIYQGGWMRQNGNMPLYSQAAMLLINGNAVASGANTATRDAKTGEILFENVPVQGSVTVTRRILINAADNYVRYIDVFKNGQPQEASVNVTFQTNFNYGVQ